MSLPECIEKVVQKHPIPGANIVGSSFNFLPRPNRDRSHSPDPFTLLIVSVVDASARPRCGLRMTSHCKNL